MSPFRIGLSPTARQHAELLRQMMRIRRFDRACRRPLRTANGRVQYGAEAIVAGTTSCLLPTDAVITAYHPHDYAVARGLSMESIRTRLLTSSPLYDAARRFYGISPSKNALSIATGAALGDRLRGAPSITACFFTADSIDEDELHECLIRSADWRLPLLWCYLSTGVTPPPLIAPSSYAMPVRAVDGRDVLEVEAATRQAVRIVRRGAGPCLLELRAPWQGRPYDPVKALARRMRSGELSSRALRSLRRMVRDEVRGALRDSPAT